MKADQERVKNLLTDTVSLLCKNGLTFQDELKVQALIGITVDSEVFIVNVDKAYQNNENSPASPDVQARVEPTPTYTENRTPRRRQQAHQQRRGDVVVDLTGPTRNGPTGSPGSRNRTFVGNSNRMGTPPNTANRRYINSPRTPTNMGMQSPSAMNQRFRAPVHSPSNRQRYMSPQQMPMMRGYSPRQQFTNNQVRRSLSTAMNNQRMPFQPSPTSPSHRLPLPPQQPPSPARDEVIVLDEPASNASSPHTTPAPSSPSQAGRVLGTIESTSTSDPITIQPDEPTVSAAEAASKEGAKEPSSESNIPSVEAEPPAATSTGTSSPALAEPLAPLEDLTATEETTENPLSKLASELADKQHKRATEPEPEKSGTETETNSSTTGTPGPKSIDVPPGTLTIIPSSPESEVMPDDTSSVATETPNPVPSTSTTITIPDTGNKDNEQTSPSLSVESIQGNFDSYEQLETFRVPKKPPDEPSADEPPAKKVRASSADDSGSNKSDSDETSTVKSERQGIDESRDQDNSDHELIAPEPKSPEKEEMEEKKSLAMKLHHEKKNLTNWRIREMLERHIVTPVLKKQEASVVAFRVSWRGEPSYVQEVWESIASKRTELDDEVVKPLGISFFLSTVTVENLPAATYPALGYWVVARHPEFDKDELVRQVRARSGGAEVRRLLKGEGGSMDEYGAICQLVKDYNDSEIEQKLKESAESCFPSSKSSRPNMVRFVLKENFFEHLLKIAVKNLRSVSFQAALDKVV